MVSDALYSVVNQAASVDLLSGTDINELEAERIKRIVSAEIQKCKLNTLNQSAACMDMLPTVTILTDLSNTVFHFLIGLGRLKSYSRFPVSRSLCLWLIAELEQCIVFFSDTIDGRGEYRLSEYTFTAKKMDLKLAFKRLEPELQASGTANALSALIFKVLKDAIFSNNRLTDGAVKQLQSAISQFRPFFLEGEEALLDFVVLFNFSDRLIYTYWTRYLERELDTFEDLNDRQTYLLSQRRRLENLLLKTGRKDPVNTRSLGGSLLKYVEEQYRFLNDNLKLRMKYHTLLNAQSSHKRFLIGLPVAQYALFIRLQMESGILNKDHVGAIFSFFSDHFYTVNAKFISAESLQKKSTDVEFSTAQKIKGQLIGMINWLNKHYNLSNFN
ncbi:hypothetical protein INP83_11595 [Mucilaginibacter sp. 21P]|uniref:hypothetical protein n=1 Tax=Mucilaginibacter sp. 21P TaxID=2778902 RepID=UPI001C597E3C|nr:hypothetical protein [Mucilaginibacter sp. 21P]QXV63751.1 hypothetical protein INP83_11595 [Mucilaginibacter sp. 21P]